jgi:hypothetical protein
MAQAIDIKGFALLRGQFWCKFGFCRSQKVLFALRKSPMKIVISIPRPLSQVTRQRKIKEKAAGFKEAQDVG